MSSIDRLASPSKPPLDGAVNQEFTLEQLERIESAVNIVLASGDGPRRSGTVVKDVLRTQDLMRTRSGSNMAVKKSPPISFLSLPAEIRNNIYRYCLVVGEVHPRPKPDQDDRLNNRSRIHKPQTQMFLLCRQIFTEAAPLYFAENKFVLSYGALPWCSQTADIRTDPISRVAHRNLRSLGITFDIQDCQNLLSALQTGMDDARFELKHFDEWYELSRLLAHLDLKLLEVSFKNCYCAFCHRRMVTTAMRLMLNGIRSSPRVVFNGLVNNQEVIDARQRIDRMSTIRFGYFWHAEYDEEDPDSKLKLGFQVTPI